MPVVKETAINKNPHSAYKNHQFLAWMVQFSRPTRWLNAIRNSEKKKICKNSKAQRKTYDNCKMVVLNYQSHHAKPNTFLLISLINLSWVSHKLQITSHLSALYESVIFAPPPLFPLTCQQSVWFMNVCKWLSPFAY